MQHDVPGSHVLILILQLKHFIHGIYSTLLPRADHDYHGVHCLSFLEAFFENSSKIWDGQTSYVREQRPFEQIQDIQYLK